MLGLWEHILKASGKTLQETAAGASLKSSKERLYQNLPPELALTLSLSRK